MRNTEHLLFGLTSGLAFSSILHISGGFQIPQTAGFIGLALLGSILPDIDTPDSLISKRIFPNMSDFITRFFKHRTYFHDPAIYLMLMIPCFFIKVPKTRTNFRNRNKRYWTRIIYRAWYSDIYCSKVYRSKLYH